MPPRIRELPLRDERRGARWGVALGTLVYQEARFHREIARRTWTVQRRRKVGNGWMGVPPGERLEPGVEYSIRRGLERRPLSSVLAAVRTEVDLA